MTFNNEMARLKRIREAYGTLNKIALSFLERYYDPHEGIFPFTVKKSHDDQLVGEGRSLRYTIIALIGLRSVEEAKNNVSIPIAEAVDRIINNRQRIKNIGDIGLLLWVTSLMSDKSTLKSICNKLLPNNFFDRSKTLSIPTLELEFLLIGLLYVSRKLNYSADTLKRVNQIYEVLLKNFNPNTGIFCFHRSSTGSQIKRYYNRTMGFLAEQIYGIYALAMYSECFDDQASLENALLCANAICRYQTEDGGWVWQYSARSLFAIEKYPLYSVHQDGMAPMAFFKLASSGEKKFLHNVLCGLDWLWSFHTCSSPLIDLDNTVIWRSVRRNGRSKNVSFLNKSANLINMNMARLYNYDGSLGIDFETRPYHYGWILRAWKEFEDLAP